MATRDSDEFVTVDQAAALLDVDRSTVRRWIGRGRLPAYRIGERHVRLKRSDLDRVVTPIAHSHTHQSDVRESVVRPAPLTSEEKAEALAVAKRARELRHELRDRWGATQRDLLAYELINLAREERSWQLS
jgi:excisionase family DNA binding protein